MGPGEEKGKHIYIHIAQELLHSHQPALIVSYIHAQCTHTHTHMYRRQEHFETESKHDSTKLTL